MSVRVVVGEDSRVGPWVCERTGGVWSPVDAIAVGLEKGGELVAGVIYDHYNGASVCMHVASDGSRQWLNKGFLQFCFEYAFDRLKVKKVIGMVPSDNVPALQFDARLGFSEEARIKDACPGGDLILLTMTRPQCRWIKEPNHGFEIVASIA
jgi:RimJ/RimL family protein N-acetyltransferase